MHNGIPNDKSSLICLSKTKKKTTRFSTQPKQTNLAPKARAKIPRAISKTRSLPLSPRAYTSWEKSSPLIAEAFLASLPITCELNECHSSLTRCHKFGFYGQGHGRKLSPGIRPILRVDSRRFIIAFIYAHKTPAIYMSSERRCARACGSAVNEPTSFARFRKRVYIIMSSWKGRRD